MRLTQFTDYALRTLMYLGTHRERLISVDEVSRVYDVSRNHLVKVVQKLVELRTIEALRGRRGGMRLIADPNELRVGWLVQRTEPDFAMAGCFHDDGRAACPIAEVCRLTAALTEATNRFIEALDRYTVADLLSPRDELIELWNRQRILTRAAGGPTGEGAAMPTDPLAETVADEVAMGT